MSHTTAWLDSVQEEATMSDNNTDRHLFKVLGSLGSDMKHVLSSQERSRDDATALRLEMKSEMLELSNKFSANIDNLNSRVDKLENWQTKMAAYMAVLIPLAILLGQAVAPLILNIL